MKEDNKIELKDLEPLIQNESHSINVVKKSEKVVEEKEKKKGCQFPSAFTILLIIHTLIFLLIYIIPKGKYDTIF